MRHFPFRPGVARRGAFGALLAATAIVGAAPAAGATITDLGPLGAGQQYFWTAVNDSGSLSGYEVTPGGTFAARAVGGVPARVGAVNTAAFAIDDAGNVFGARDGVRRDPVWWDTAGTLHEIPNTVAAETHRFHWANGTWAVGVANNAAFVAQGPAYAPVTIPGCIEVSAVSTSGIVVCAGPGVGRIMWQNGTSTPITTGTLGKGAIAANGDLVFTNGVRVVVRRAGQDTTLPDPPGTTDQAFPSQNDSGEVVSTATVGGQQRAVMWDAGQPVLLNDLLPAGSGWDLRTAGQITNSGKIFGTGTLNGAQRYYLLDLGSCTVDAPDVFKVASGKREFATGCGPSGIDWTAPERLTPKRAEVYSGVFGAAANGYVYPGKWRLDVFLKDGAQKLTTPADCANPLVEWRWSVVQADQVVTAPAAGCETTMEVKKLGKYDVVAKKYTRRDPAAAWTYARVQVKGKVEAKDWLVVAMGDSNGSGEANPPFQWARCNRSEASHQWKTARYLETQDKRSSVTLIWTSCSGARVSHLITHRYSGTRPAKPWLPPQIDQVLAVLAQNKEPVRRPDAVLISIGVNDLFFGAVGEWCATHPASPLRKSQQCETMPVDFLFNEAANTYRFKAAKGRPTVGTWVTRFLAQLPKKYAKLRTELAKPVDGYQGLGVTANQVVLSKYPDFSRDETGRTCDTTGAVNAVFRWNRNTWRWFGGAAGRLNGRITDAGALGFRSSTMKANAFARHGFCAGAPRAVLPGFWTLGYSDSWIRGPARAFYDYDVAGPLHPTDPGHDVQAEGMQAPFCRILYTNTTCVGKWVR